MTERFDCIRFIKNEKTGKTFAHRLGSATRRDDGGFSVFLDSLPPDGRFAITPPRPKAEAKPDANASAAFDDEVPF